MSTLTQLTATAVGSLPHADPMAAVDIVLNSLRVAPHPPQLSRRDPREQMWIQFTENVPRFRTDPVNLKYFFDTTGNPENEVADFYNEYLQIIEGGAPDYFVVGPDYGTGIHAFLDRLRTESTKRPFVKVQVTGPLSFALTVGDETGKPIFYHPLFRDVAVKSVGLKAIWMVEAFRPFADQVIIFFDEPSLSAYGSSAFLGVSKNDVVETLNEVTSMVADRGAIPGVHCCGNTDWSLVMDTATVIVNFDAVDYLDSLSIYVRELRGFVDRGGILAWGAVPNTAAIRQTSVSQVAARIRGGLDMLEKAGVDRSALTSRMIVTPACGCAAMTQADAEQVYKLLGQLESEDPETIFKS